MFVVYLDGGYDGVSTMKTGSTKRVSCCEEPFIKSFVQVNHKD